VIGHSDIPDPVRIARIRIPVPRIDFTSEVIKHHFCGLPGGADIEAISRLQLDAGRDEMQLMVSGVRMTHPEDVVPVSLQSRKSDLLEPVHDGLLLRRRDIVLRCERQDTRRIPVLKFQ
jgi:hypothetical protein